MASIVTGLVTHWACLGCSGSAYTTACVTVPANIQQLCTAIEEEWTKILHATINNLINSMQSWCVALHEANGGHIRYWLVFGPPNTVKLQILKWPFIVASLRHTCAIITLSNQHLYMPHLWGGWIISAKEKWATSQQWLINNAKHCSNTSSFAFWTRLIFTTVILGGRLV